jgi:hypothetical protein
MPIHSIVVTSCEADGYPIVPPDIAAFATGLAGAAPLSMVVTNDQVFNLYTLHSYVKMKIADLASPDLGLNLDQPRKLAHEVDPNNGNWTTVNHGVALIYEVWDFNNERPTYYVGFTLGTDAADPGAGPEPITP